MVEHWGGIKNTELINWIKHFMFLTHSEIINKIQYWIIQSILFPLLQPVKCPKKTKKNRRLYGRQLLSLNGWQPDFAWSINGWREKREAAGVHYWFQRYFFFFFLPSIGSAWYLLASCSFVFVLIYGCQDREQKLFLIFCDNCEIFNDFLPECVQIITL